MKTELEEKFSSFKQDVDSRKKEMLEHKMDIEYMQKNFLDNFYKFFEMTLNSIRGSLRDANDDVIDKLDQVQAKSTVSVDNLAEVIIPKETHVSNLGEIVIPEEISIKNFPDIVIPESVTVKNLSELEKYLKAPEVKVNVEISKELKPLLKALSDMAVFKDIVTVVPEENSGSIQRDTQGNATRIIEQFPDRKIETTFQRNNLGEIINWVSKRI